METTNPTTDLRIDQWYDRSLRSWRTMILSASGNQIGDALYDGNRADAAASVKFLQGRIDRDEVVVEEWER